MSNGHDAPGVTVVASAAALFAFGFLLNELPSESLHDRFRALFVAPMMIALMVEIVAVPMLVWSWLPRRQPPPSDFESAA